MSVSIQESASIEGSLSRLAEKTAAKPTLVLFTAVYSHCQLTTAFRDIVYKVVIL